MGEIRITESEFTEILSAIKKQIDHDKECTDAFNIILSKDYTMGYQVSLVDDMVNILDRMTNKSQWVDYFVYELEFGKKWNKGMVTDKGKDVRLKTVKDLWKMLHK